MKFSGILSVCDETNAESLNEEYGVHELFTEDT